MWVAVKNVTVDVPQIDAVDVTNLQELRTHAESETVMKLFRVDAILTESVPAESFRFFYIAACV